MRGTSACTSCVAVTDEAVQIHRNRSGILTIFARNRVAALEAEDVPAMVKQTLSSWEVNDRPFWVRVAPDQHTGELNDLYYFKAPVKTSAPTWWMRALAEYHGDLGAGRGSRPERASARVRVQ